MIATRFYFAHIAILAVVFFAFPVFGDTVVSQTTGGTNGNSFISTVLGRAVQDLGTGISGTGTQFSFGWVATSSVTTGYMYVELLECDQGGASISALNPTNCVRPTGWPAGNGAFLRTDGYGAGTYTFSTSTTNTGVAHSVTFNPSKYYKLFYEFADNGVSTVRGSSSNVYSGGACYAYDGGSNNACGSVVDTVFTILGAVGATQSTSEGVKTIISPTFNLTTANNTPTFSFTYYSTHYNRAGFLLKDFTNGSSINTASASSSIISSGSGTYSQPFGLTTGHMYQWTPMIYDITGANPTLYGTPTTFFAVTTAGYQSLPEQLYNPFSSTASTSAYTGLMSSTTASSTNYTATYQFGSTTALGRCFRGLPDSMRNAMVIKFPFSYVCDAQNLITEMINGNGLASGNLQISLNNLATTTLIDKQAVSAIPAVQTIKRVAGYAIYLSTAFAIMWAVIRIF